MTPELTIILAEDDDGHATLIRRNIARAGLHADVVRFHDGGELFDALSNGHPLLTPGRRVLLLLDLSMPKVDGMEVLRRLKSNAATATIPVYMLTTTDNPAEIDSCFALGCNAYVTKPVSYEAFATALGQLCSFLQVTQIPTLPDRSNHVFA